MRVRIQRQNQWYSVYRLISKLQKNVWYEKEYSKTYYNGIGNDSGQFLFR